MATSATIRRAVPGLSGLHDAGMTELNLTMKCDTEPVSAFSWNACWQQHTISVHGTGLIAADKQLTFHVIYYGFLAILNHPLI